MLFLDENKLPRPDKPISLTIVPEGLKPIVLGKVSVDGALVMKSDSKKRPLANRCATLRFLSISSNLLCRISPEVDYRVLVKADRRFHKDIEILNGTLSSQKLQDVCSMTKRDEGYGVYFGYCMLVAYTDPPSQKLMFQVIMNILPFSSHSDIRSR